MRKRLYSERLEISLTPRQKDQLAQEASEKELTINQLIREIIENYLS